MIGITVKKDENGIYNGLLVEGHAGYDEYGKDIVCAAVSVLVINTINSMEAFTQSVLNVHTQEEDGIIEFEVVSAIDKETRLLLDSLLLGIEGIETSYGKDYIRVFK